MFVEMKYIGMFRSSIVLLCLFAISGCQSSNNQQEQETYTANINVPKPLVLQTEPVAPLASLPELKAKKSKEPIADSSLHAPKEQRTTVDDLIKKQNARQSDSPLLNRQMCRDDIDVVYRVPDQNGFHNQFTAKVQAQGLVVELSSDHSKVKIRITGWYSKNTNLHQWRPFLTEPPIAKGLMLATDAEFWNDTHLWYPCTLSAI